MRKGIIAAACVATVVLFRVPARADDGRMPLSGHWSFKLTNAPTPVIASPPTFYVVAYGPSTDLSPLAPDTVQIVYAHTVTITTQWAVAGDMLITMPNGDTLRAHLSGTANPDPSVPVLAIDQSGKISGGTGLFRGARGAFVATGHVNLATLAGAVTIDGWLALDDGERD